MPDKEKDASPDSGGAGGEGATATKPKSKRSKKPRPKTPPPRMLPPWKVLLHNDDHNTFEYVIFTIIELTPLKPYEAVQRTAEAHNRGLALLLTTHKERAELFKDQFTSKGLTVTIEPAEK